MVRAISGSTLLREVKGTLQRIAKADVVCHWLDEASRCFQAEAYDAAIVMAWSATIADLVAEVNRIGSEVFQYAFRKEYPDRKKVPNGPEELVGDDDKAFVQVCVQMRFLRVAKEDLHRFRECRNKSAHPSGYQADEHEATRFLGLCLKIVNRQVDGVHILNDTLLVDYALESGHSAETIVDLVDSDYRLSAAMKLMNTYLSNSGPEYDALIGVWYRIWDLLSEAEQTQMWRKIASEVVRALKGRNNFRNGEELARFIVWPDPGQKHLYRDFIAGQYIATLRRKVQDGTFSSEDKDFALWLYDKLPRQFQRQIIRLCVRWLIRRVRRGDFDGSDLDFNAWLKQQSDAGQQTRFQVIRDAIVRRY